MATKVAVQMAAKLGAEPWSVKIPLSDCMVVGYDSYHDTAGPNRSVGAVVSTTNQALTRFHSSCVMHEHGEEIHTKIKECLTKALRVWMQENKKAPGEDIIFGEINLLGNSLSLFVCCISLPFLLFSVFILNHRHLLLLGFLTIF